MYVSELYAAGFRCFGQETPLALKLRRGLNVLVGPNNSGKTAIIDAVRFVLWTRGDDFLRLDPADFHVGPNGQRVADLLIGCTFDDLTPDEQVRFLEWCTNEAECCGCMFVSAAHFANSLAAAMPPSRNTAPAGTPTGCRSKEIFASI